MSEKINIFWFRRDLRTEDNVGLYKALQGKNPVLPLFIFDTEILQKLPENDARVTFLHNSLKQLKSRLQHYGSDIVIYSGSPVKVFTTICEKFNVQNVITNRDYEPYATERDQTISALLSEKKIGFYTYKDQVIFEKDEIVKSDGNPYVVYTPYSKIWLKNLNINGLKVQKTSEYFSNLKKIAPQDIPTLKEMGFLSSSIVFPSYDVSEELMKHYEATRNFPAKERGTSHLSTHLRFGTLGIRDLVHKTLKIENPTFLKELIWREFFMQILWHFPHTHEKAFKPAYDRIEWRNNEEEFELWKAGSTGYPLVDAGMRELNTTGLMHNRVRMLVASFLCKHLLIDWRWGEAYFAEKLLDYEMSSNVGNWQWAAGSGVDAAPYFRIFNPTTQIEKFDKNKAYILKWIPEINTASYPKPMVEHKTARERCLSTYKAALQN